MIMRIQERILPGEVIWQFPRDFVRIAGFSTGHSNPPVAYNSGVRPPLQSKQKRGLCILPSRAILNPTGDASNEVRAVSIRRAIHHIPSER